jgi:hypothetical protein
MLFPPSTTTEPLTGEDASVSVGIAEPVMSRVAVSVGKAIVVMVEVIRAACVGGTTVEVGGFSGGTGVPHAGSIMAMAVTSALNI